MSRAQVLPNPAHRDTRNASTRAPLAVTFPQLIAILLPISFALISMMGGVYLLLHHDIRDLREDVRENHEILIENQIELAEGLARIEGYMAAQSEQD